jgi:hypothetical protein
MDACREGRNCDGRDTLLEAETSRKIRLQNYERIFDGRPQSPELEELSLSRRQFKLEPTGILIDPAQAIDPGTTYILTVPDCKF